MRGFVEEFFFTNETVRIYNASMQGIRTLKIVTGSLRAISLPTLRIPFGNPEEPKKEELVQWGIKIFEFSLIAHIQKILAGLVQLAEAENVAASAPVCRHVFEWAALSCFLTSKFTDQFKWQDWEEAWKLLTKVTQGSLWNRIHGTKYAGIPPTTPSIDCPTPVYIPEAVKEYEYYQSSNSKYADARDNYSFLCDFAHANAACLQRYYEYEENGVVVRFIDPDLDPQGKSFLPFVNCCLIDLLTFGYELLGLANESEVRPKILVVRNELARLAPARLTGSIPDLHL